VYRSDATPAATPARGAGRGPARAAARERRAVSPSQLAGAREIIGNYSMLAAGAGLVPVPIVDVVAIGGVQLKMIAALAEHYRTPFSEDRGKAMLAAVAGGVFSTRFAYGIGGSLLKAIPVVGPMISAWAMPGFGGAFTYAVGEMFVKHFESGGTLLNFDAVS
jgi:uncharacterized protein (DUF697 family)